RRHADVDRIDRHGADRRVRRVLARCLLVEREQLQHAHAPALQPRRRRGHVADVADSPARRRRAGEQRDQETRAPASGRRAHARPTRQSKCRSMRATPSANTSRGGSSETTRKASRGKSKKNPGCTSTPSSVNNRTTRSSSGSIDGTWSTPYHPPSPAKTRQDGAADPIAVSAA